MRDVVLSDPRVQQPSWIRSYLAPSFTAGASEHAYALEVLAEIFGGTSTSRLYRSLVIDQKLATSAGAFYRGSSLDLTTFRIYATPRPGISLDELEAAVEAELERLKEEPITDRGSRAGHAPSGRRGDLRAGQPEHGGAQLRRGARHRAHGRGRRGVARADRRGHARRRSMPPRRMCSGPRSRSPAALCRRRSRSRAPRRRRRAPPAGAHRRGRNRGGAGLSMTDAWRRALLAASVVTIGLLGRGAGRPRGEQGRARGQPGRDRGLPDRASPSIPFLSLALHFRGGSALDPAGREGLAYMVSGLLDEGAGDLDSQAFRVELEDRAIRLSFEAGRDEFSGQLKTLTGRARARVRAAGPGAEQAALRCGAGGADPATDPGRAAAARRGSGLPGIAHLVRDGLPQPSLRPAGAGHGREPGRHHRRRSAAVRPTPAGQGQSGGRRRRRRDRGRTGTSARSCVWRLCRRPARRSMWRRRCRPQPGRWSCARTCRKARWCSVRRWYALQRLVPGDLS